MICLLLGHDSLRCYVEVCSESCWKLFADTQNEVLPVLLVRLEPLKDKVSSLICDQLYHLPWQGRCVDLKEEAGGSGIAVSLWDYLKLASN